LYQKVDSGNSGLAINARSSIVPKIVKMETKTCEIIKNILVVVFKDSLFSKI
jgi:hypothetical protein